MRPGSYEVEDPEDYAIDDIFDAEEFSVNGCAWSLAEISSKPIRKALKPTAIVKPWVPGESERLQLQERSDAKIRAKIAEMAAVADAAVAGFTLHEIGVIQGALLVSKEQKADIVRRYEEYWHNQ
jgi:hypothetical protein